MPACQGERREKKMTTIKNYKICTGTTIEGLEGEVKETMNSQEIGGMGWKWVPCGGIILK